MFFLAYKWRMLSKFACFAMEGSDRRVKRIMRNNEGLSLLRGKLGPQVVMDKDTIDDILRREGWDPTKRDMRGQGPLRVRIYAARARQKALSDQGDIKTLQPRLRARKRRR